MYQCIYVPPGNRTNLLLSDGTNVWLSANTTFRYPMIFSEKNREVTLDGEAYFQVAKDKKPFLIKTDKYAIEVLGTTFNVEAYTGKQTFKTILYEGKVRLTNTRLSEAVGLVPGQTAVLVGQALEVVPTNMYMPDFNRIYF